MALQGTIKDFGLGDIFQLIGIQRKTGVLTLENGADTVTIRFVDGNVVGADMRERSVEELLGSVLVRSGRISDVQLEEALRSQRRTLKRLGHVLVEQRLISAEDLIDGLRTQSLQIVYRLFRWRTGSFRFRSAERLDYDERHFLPISADTILMEGARMIDEWPIIERQVRSDKTVFRRLPAADALCSSSDTIVDQAPGEGSASREEREVLELVDGTRTVGQICDRSTVGEFDTWRFLADLARRGLIAEAKLPTLAATVPLGRRWIGSAVELTLCVAVLALAGVSLVDDRRGPAVPWAALGSSTTHDVLQRHASQVRLERIERAIRLFYLDRGSFPARLEDLLGTPYVASQDLIDPSGRPFMYQVDPGGFRLFALTLDGHADPERTLSHRFTALQRAMRPGAPPPAPSPP